MRRIANLRVSGYIGAVSVGEPANDQYCTAGSKNLIFQGANKANNYKGPALQGGVNGNPTMFSVPEFSYSGLGTAVAAGIGSVIESIGRILGFIGTGTLYISGVSRAIAASTALQLLLFKSGSYSGAGTGPFTAGLIQPPAPFLSASTTVSTVMVGGVYSMVFWRIRSVTGGLSRRSTLSNVITITGTKVLADFPALDSNGQDRWGIGVTAAGFGATGPHYKLLDIADSTIRRTVTDAVMNNGSPNLASATSTFTAADVGKQLTVTGAGPAGGLYTGRVLTFTDATHVIMDTNAQTNQAAGTLNFNTYEFEWADGDLIGQDLSPILDFPPPAAVWAVAIEDAMAVIGCFGDPVLGATASKPGTAVNVSRRVFIESYPVENLLFLPQAPIDVVSGASDGFAWIGCAQNICALLYTGQQPPMSLQTVWKNIGIQNQGQMCIGGGGRLYVYSAQVGLIRISDRAQPDSEFAIPVSDDLAGFSVGADVRLGFDPSFFYVLVGYHQTLLAWNEQLERWCTPLDLSSSITGNIVAIVTTPTGALIAASDGATIRLYTFSGGTGTVTVVNFPQQVSPEEQTAVMRVEPRLRLDSVANPVLVKLFRNGDSAAVVSKSVTPPRTGLQTIRRIRPNMRNAKFWQLQVQFTGAGGDCGLEDTPCYGEHSEIPE